MQWQREILLWILEMPSNSARIKTNKTPKRFVYVVVEFSYKRIGSTQCLGMESPLLQIEQSAVTMARWTMLHNANKLWMMMMNEDTLWKTGYVIPWSPVLQSQLSRNSSYSIKSPVFLCTEKLCRVQYNSLCYGLEQNDTQTIRDATLCDCRQQAHFLAYWLLATQTYTVRQAKNLGRIFHHHWWAAPFNPAVLGLSNRRHPVHSLQI